MEFLKIKGRIWWPSTSKAVFCLFFLYFNVACATANAQPHDYIGSARIVTTYSFICEDSNGSVTIADDFAKNRKFVDAMFNGTQIEFLQPMNHIEEKLKDIHVIYAECSAGGKIGLTLAGKPAEEYLANIVIYLELTVAGVRLSKTACEPQKARLAFDRAQDNPLCESLIGDWRLESPAN